MLTERQRRLLEQALLYCVLATVACYYAYEGRYIPVFICFLIGGFNLHVTLLWGAFLGTFIGGLLCSLLSIINASGAVVKEYSRDAVVGSNTWEFDLSGLVAGAYSFVVQSPNQFASGIFFKF